MFIPPFRPAHSQLSPPIGQGVKQLKGNKPLPGLVRIMVNQQGMQQPGGARFRQAAPFPLLTDRAFQPREGQGCRQRAVSSVKPHQAPDGQISQMERLFRQGEAVQLL